MAPESMLTHPSLLPHERQDPSFDLEVTFRGLPVRPVGFTAILQRETVRAIRLGLALTGDRSQPTEVDAVTR